MAKQAKTADSSVKAAQATSEDAVALLSSDHRKVESLFAQFTSATDDGRKAQLVHQICIELTVHMMLEEELFYAECRSAGVETEPLDEAQVEHDGAKILIQDLLKQRPGDEFYEAKVIVLREQIKHHVAEEEKPDEGIFARARAAGMNLQELGKRIKERKTELMGRAERPDFRPPRVRSLDVGTSSSEKERDMERYDRDRDEYGRFMSEDEHRGRYRGGYGSRSQEDDDYGRGGGSGRGRGWYGDPEGHSRASEEGWQHRGGGGSSGRGRGYEDDDRGYGGGSSGGRGRGGWFGDSEGHSRASEDDWQHRAGGYSGRGRGDEDDDRRSGGGSSGGRGHGGWFGDPEGHSRASEEGWRSRGGGGYSGRDRGYEDDDRRSGGGRGQGHGGWFGDPEGHSRASEEGWQHRGSRSRR